MAVCVGIILLATTGMLDGRKATTNKPDFSENTPLGPDVNWITHARRVEDGKFFIVSGVSAGISMTLAAIAQIFGDTITQGLAEGSEYEWHNAFTSRTRPTEPY
jgi:transcriptional regulator GlxA family with amidase domain